LRNLDEFQPASQSNSYANRTLYVPGARTGLVRGAARAGLGDNLQSACKNALCVGRHYMTV
jgi:hypothetical protein